MGKSLKQKEEKKLRDKLLVNWRLLRHIFGSTVGLFVSKRNKKGSLYYKRCDATQIKLRRSHLSADFWRPI